MYRPHCAWPKLLKTQLSFGKGSQIDLRTNICSFAGAYQKTFSFAALTRSFSTETSQLVNENRTSGVLSQSNSFIKTTVNQVMKNSAPGGFVVSSLLTNVLASFFFIVIAEFLNDFLTTELSNTGTSYHSSSINTFKAGIEHFKLFKPD